MSWNGQLAGRLTLLPEILAGPILRRVTPNSVSVWVALRVPGFVSLGVYVSSTIPGHLFMSPVTTLEQVGTNLYVAVVTARWSADMDRGALYYYDLTFNIAGVVKTMAELAGATTDLTYDTGTRPSFSLPPAARDDLRVFHASCRKPHSHTFRDALDIVGEEIGVSLALENGADQRPHQLFLTGDQIYADSVADPLLLMVADAAMTLVGDETVPVDEITSFPALPPPNKRTRYIRDNAKLTTGATRSHLISFGEFMAMYLFVWSDVLWPADIPEYTSLPPESHEFNVDETAWNHEERVKAEVVALKAFKARLQNVRKTLANVPTYMIFDDHEVSDDWNLDRKWCHAVYASPLGRRIISNALLGYAVCQHWGNTPEQFEVGAGREILTRLQSGDLYTDAATTERTEELLGLHSAAQLAVRLFSSGSYALYHDAGDAGIDDTSRRAG